MEEALITRWETSEFVRRIWLAMQASTVYPPDLLPLLQNCVALYRQHLDADDVEDFCALRRLDAMLHGVEENWSDEWLLGHLPTTAQTTASGHGDLDVEKEFSEMRTRRQRSTFKVKPLRVKYVVLLHLFSGHRRHGDVQDQFERLQHTSSYPLHGLSVDIVISLKFENILDIEIQRLFRAAVHDGHIAAIVAGPPCETWSKAREQYYANQQGQRPVRTIEHPYGMQQLRLKELTQLLVGNDLLGAAVISVTLLGLQDASCWWNILRNLLLSLALQSGSWVSWSCSFNSQISAGCAYGRDIMAVAVQSQRTCYVSTWHLTLLRSSSVTKRVWRSRRLCLSGKTSLAGLRRKL